MNDAIHTCTGPSQRSHRRLLILGVLLALVPTVLAAATPAQAEAQAEAQAQRDDRNRRQLGEDLQPACTAQLEDLGRAIALYREAHGELPMWLSDLLDEGYLSDPSLAVCPVTRETGELPDLRFYHPDPGIPGAYLYEFNPDMVDANRGLTMRAWKLRQLDLVGDRVPMVRCVLHGHVLNLSVGGRIYESDLDWEKDIEDPVLRAKASFTWDGGPVPGAPEQSDALQLVGTRLEPIRLELLGGGILDSDTFGDHEAVLLYVWTTWCGSCTRVLPWIEEFARDYASRGLEVVTINVGDSPEVARQLLEDRELDLPVALDTGSVLKKAGVGTALPTTMVIDREGIITYSNPGMGSNFVTEVREAVEAALR